MFAASEYKPCGFVFELVRAIQDAEAKGTNCSSHQAAFSQVARALEQCLHRHLRSHNCLNCQANESARAA